MKSPCSSNWSTVQAVHQDWLPRTHDIFSYNPCFLNYSVVEAVQQGWTIYRTHEMFSYNPCSLNFSVVRAFRLDVTTLNSWNIIILSFFPELLGSSSSSAVLNFFKLVKTLLPFLFFNYSVVQAAQQGWITSNTWKLVIYSRIVHFITRGFK